MLLMKLNRNKTLALHLGNYVVNNLLSHQVTFVADKQPIDVLTCIALNLLKPLLYIVERFLAIHVMSSHVICYLLE